VHKIGTSGKNLAQQIMFKTVVKEKYSFDSTRMRKFLKALKLAGRTYGKGSWM